MATTEAGRAGPIRTVASLCERVARALLVRHPVEVEQMTHLNVLAVCCYDIGIASAWRSTRVSLSPDQWRERLR